MLIKVLHKGQFIYRGTSGSMYQYDLSDPMDKLQYQIDIDAQQRDIMSINPFRQLENGGGIYEK